MKRSILLSILELILIGCNSSAPSTSTSTLAEGNQSTSANERKNWDSSTSSNPIDGSKTVVLKSYSTNERDSTLVIRVAGKKLDVYVITGDVVEGESASVRIKFDKDVPTKQIWNRSEDYKAVFSPDPFGLLAKLQRSTQFYIEYSPYARVPETIIFDVAGLSSAMPEELIDVLKKRQDDLKKKQGDLIALRARISLHVHECRQKKNDGSLMYPAQWCWSDPESENFHSDLLPFPTKEEAIENALEMTRAGRAFKAPRN